MTSLDARDSVHMQPQFVLLQISISVVNHDGRVRRVPCCIGRLSPPPSRSSLPRSYERGLTTPRPKRNSRRLKVSRPGPAGAALRCGSIVRSFQWKRDNRPNLIYIEWKLNEFANCVLRLRRQQIYGRLSSRFKYILLIRVHNFMVVDGGCAR